MLLVSGRRYSPHTHITGCHLPREEFSEPRSCCNNSDISVWRVVLSERCRRLLCLNWFSFSGTARVALNITVVVNGRGV